MRKKSYEAHTLIEPQMALRVYLDALLCGAAFAVEEEPALPLQTEIAIESDVELIQKQAPPEEVKETVSVTEAKPPVAKAAENALSIIQPAWAQTQFQCLSFKVAGVILAAPLEKLHGIVELTEQITELPGYAPWALGLLPNAGQNVQVVDIAQIIMLDNERADSRPASERMKYLVLVDGGRFGLAVDSISQVLTLEPEDVRWRRVRSRRPWLVGTVIDKMCALLEIDELCVQLQAGLENAG